MKEEPDNDYTKVDYHFHSAYSFDSEAPPVDMVEEALKKGLKEICFTEHKDLEPQYFVVDFYDDSRVTASIKALQREYAGRIRIKKGVELDFQTETIPDFEKFIDTYKFDYILASVHALEHEFVGPEFFHRKKPDEAFRLYFDEVLSLSTLKSFDILGHLDYVKRHSPVKLNPEKYESVLRRILDNIISNGKGVELNTSGWRHAPGEPYPSPFILKLYREMGGEIVTIGSDAHNAGDMGRDIDRGLKLLEEIGFSGIYLFEDRKKEKIYFRTIA
jgi:histidinol-phosphatase (PHP family)